MDRIEPYLKILVAACGNPDAGDDSFGHLVADRLRARQVPNLTVLDFGMRPAALLDHLPGPSALFIVDAVHWPGAPAGKLIDIDWFDPECPPLESDTALSTHGLSIAQQLDLAQSLALLPPVVRLIGMTIGNADIGRPVTESVRAGVPLTLKIIRRYALCEFMFGHPI